MKTTVRTLIRTPWFKLKEIIKPNSDSFKNITVGNKVYYSARFPGGITEDQIKELVEQAEAFLEEYKPLVCDK